MNTELASFCDTFAASYKERPVDTNWQLFKTEMLRLIAKYIPTITITERAQSPWFNSVLNLLNNKKKRLFRIAKHSNNDAAWDKYFRAASEYKKSLYTAKHNFFNNTLPSMLRNDPKQFWKTINPSVSTSISLFHNDGYNVPEHEVAGVLNDAFCAVFTNETFVHLPSPPNYAHPQMYPITSTRSVSLM